MPGLRHPLPRRATLRRTATPGVDASTQAAPAPLRRSRRRDRHLQPRPASPTAHGTPKKNPENPLTKQMGTSRQSDQPKGPRTLTCGGSDERFKLTRVAESIPLHQPGERRRVRRRTVRSRSLRLHRINKAGGESHDDPALFEALGHGYSSHRRHLAQPAPRTRPRGHRVTLATSEAVVVQLTATTAAQGAIFRALKVPEPPASWTSPPPPTDQLPRVLA